MLCCCLQLRRRQSPTQFGNATECVYWTVRKCVENWPRIIKCSVRVRIYAYTGFGLIFFFSWFNLTSNKCCQQRMNTLWCQLILSGSCILFCKIKFVQFSSSGFVVVSALDSDVGGVDSECRLSDFLSATPPCKAMANEAAVLLLSKTSLLSPDTKLWIWLLCFCLQTLIFYFFRNKSRIWLLLFISMPWKEWVFSLLNFKSLVIILIMFTFKGRQLIFLSR